MFLATTPSLAVEIELVVVVRLRVVLGKIAPAPRALAAKEVRDGDLRILHPSIPLCLYYLSVWDTRGAPHPSQDIGLIGPG
eukprot:895133-Pleurochrysis_carterae.AAC.1